MSSIKRMAMNKDKGNLGLCLPPASSPSGLARVERRDLGVVFKSPGTEALSPLFVTGILRTWAGHESFCRGEACFKPGLLA